MKNRRNTNSARKRLSLSRREGEIIEINDKTLNDDKTNVSTKVLMQRCHHSNFALQQSPNPKIILVPLTLPTPIHHNNLAEHNRKQKIEKSKYFASTLVLNRSVFLIATCLIVLSTLLYPGNIPRWLFLNAFDNNSCY